jgi:N-acylneuraminate cytidylyltransferase
MRFKILGLITARGGSKGIPGKNIKLLGGKPLIAYTIEAAQQSGVFDRLILSSDDPRIIEIARAYGCEVPFVRPAELAADSTPHLPVVQHAVEWLKAHENYQPDYVMILQPTSPLRQPFHIQAAAGLLQKSGADSVVSVSKIPEHYHPRWQLTFHGEGKLAIFTGEPFAEIVRRRQDLPPTYTRNGAIYLFKTVLLFDPVEPNFYGAHVVGYPMDEKYSVSIDGEEDWERAERLVEALHERAS